MKKLYQKEQKDNKITKSYVSCPFCRRRHIVSKIGDNSFFCNITFKEFNGDQTFLGEFK